MSGGEGRAEDIGELDIVKAGEGDVFRDAETESAEFAESAGGHEIVHAYDGGRLEAFAVDGSDGFAAATETIGAGGGAVIDGGGELPDDFQEGLFAVLQWAEGSVVTDEGETAVAELDVVETMRCMPAR